MGGFLGEGYHVAIFVTVHHSPEANPYLIVSHHCNPLPRLSRGQKSTHSFLTMKSTHSYLTIDASRIYLSSSQTHLTQMLCEKRTRCFTYTTDIWQNMCWFITYSHYCQHNSDLFNDRVGDLVFLVGKFICPISHRFLGLEGRLWIDHPGPSVCSWNLGAHRNIRSQQRIRTGCSVSVSSIRCLVHCSIVLNWKTLLYLYKCICVYTHTHTHTGVRNQGQVSTLFETKLLRVSSFFCDSQIMLGTDCWHFLWGWGWHCILVRAGHSAF